MGDHNKSANKIKISKTLSREHETRSVSSMVFIISCPYHPRSASSHVCIIPCLYHPMSVSSQVCIIPGLYHPMSVSSQICIIPGQNVSFFVYFIPCLHHTMSVSSQVCIIPVKMDVWYQLMPGIFQLMYFIFRSDRIIFQTLVKHFNLKGKSSSLIPLIVPSYL